MKKMLTKYLMWLTDKRLLLISLIVGFAGFLPMPLRAQNTQANLVAPAKCERTRKGTKVIVLLRGDATPAQSQLICFAETYLEQAVNNPRFEKRIKGGIIDGVNVEPIKFNETRFRTAAGQSLKKSPDQIWTIVQQGTERTNIGTNEINIHLDLVPKRRPTIGSTVLGKQPVRTGYWFVEEALKRSDGVSVARHLMHEWLHIAGFYHYPDNSARGDVPYELGNLVSEMLRDQKEREEATRGLQLAPESILNMKALFNSKGEDPVLAYILGEAEEDLDMGDANFDN